MPRIKHRRGVARSARANETGRLGPRDRFTREARGRVVPGPLRPHGSGLTPAGCLIALARLRGRSLEGLPGARAVLRIGARSEESRIENLLSSSSFSFSFLTREKERRALQYAPHMQYVSRWTASSSSPELQPQRRAACAPRVLCACVHLTEVTNRGNATPLFVRAASSVPPIARPPRSLDDSSRDALC